MPGINNLTTVLNNLKLTNGIAVGFSLIDKNFKINWINTTQKNWFKNENKICGEHCYEIYEKRTAVCKNCPCKKTFSDGRVHKALRFGIIIDGENRTYQIIANPIKDKNNKVVRVLELTQDVTKQIKKSKFQSRKLNFLQKSYKKLKQANSKLTSKINILKSVAKETYSANKKIKSRYKVMLKKLFMTEEELHDLFIVNKVVSSNGSTLKVFSLITRLVKQIMRADIVTVRTIDNEHQVLIPKSCAGINKDILLETPIKVGQSFEGLVAQHGNVLTCEDMQTDTRTVYCEKVKDENIHSAIFVPAIFNHQNLAVITAMYHKVREFSKDEVELMKAFANQIAIAIQETMNCEDVHKNYFNTLRALVLAMEARDPYTRGHSERVTKYSLDIAHRLHLPEKALSIIKYAGTVHDVGKIGISDVILNKPGKLTPTERAIIELHPIKGAQMLEPLNFMKTGIPLVRNHHERFDGNGYPDRIAGEEIPLSARIITCADSFDAMTSDRPYRFKKMNAKEAITELKANSGTQFDPKIVPVFIELINKEKYI
jgi:HD-GYP domain-containing protein (c-di-GMP phosphodiesterase class II)